LSKLIVPKKELITSFNPKLADRAVKFINVLKHTKGEWHGKDFKLLPWQDKIVKEIFGTVKENGYRLYNTAYIEIPKKMGKQLSLDTLISTPSGYTTMGEIQTGDFVFDENGNPCKVVAISEIDETEAAYKTIFRNGETIIAGERHLWNVEATRNKYKKEILTSGEIYQKYNSVKNKERRALYRIRIAKPFSMLKKEVVIDAYTFGFWIGNGCATKPELTVMGDDVEDIRVKCQ